MASDHILIRLAKAGDDEQCAKIFLHARRTAFQWVDPELIQFDDFARETEDEEVWVAEAGSTILGFAAIYARHEHNFLHHLYLDPEMRGRGIGSSLHHRAMLRLGRPASLKCLEANLSARRFYAKHGWIESARGDSRFGSYVVCTKT